MTNVVSDFIVVHADPEAVWDVIADFETYPDWQPDVKEVVILETFGDGWGKKVRFEVDAKVLQATLVLEYAYTDTSMSWWLVDGVNVRKNDGTYTVEAQDDGTTMVTYELEVIPTIPLPGFVRRIAAKRIVETALRDMKQRAEART